jgi:hypothetical protein
VSQDLYSIEQVAAILGLRVGTVREGRLKVVRIGSCLFNGLQAATRYREILEITHTFSLPRVGDR